jgi:hypothetical protein
MHATIPPHAATSGAALPSDSNGPTVDNLLHARNGWSLARTSLDILLAGVWLGALGSWLARTRSDARAGALRTPSATPRPRTAAGARMVNVTRVRHRIVIIAVCGLEVSAMLQLCSAKPHVVRPARRIRGVRCVATAAVPAGALELANRLADVAGEITCKYFRWVHARTHVLHGANRIPETVHHHQTHTPSPHTVHR